MKKCPACHAILEEKNASGITVDLCSKGCGGIWLEMDEIENFDESSESIATLVVKGNPEVVVDTLNQIRNCPCCENQIMVKRSYDIFSEVEVDQCLKCSGIWLDKGELETIREQFPTEAAREQVSGNFLAAKLSETEQEIEERIAENQELSEREKNKIMYKLFKYVFGVSEIS